VTEERGLHLLVFGAAVMGWGWQSFSAGLLCWRKWHSSAAGSWLSWVLRVGCL
jgi:hypothetical protein